MSMAFSFFGGVVVAIVLRHLLEAREEERWATFDAVTLQHLKGRLERFIDGDIKPISFVTYQKEKEAIPPLLLFNFKKYDEDEDVRTALRAMSTNCHNKYQSTMGSLVIKRKASLRRHLSLLASALTFLPQSPFTPKALISKVQLMSAWSEELIYRLDMPEVEDADHANNVLQAFFNLTEYVWDVYDLASEALHAKSYR